MEQTAYEDLVVRLVKMLDIGWASMSYFLLAVLMIAILNRISRNSESVLYEQKSTPRLVFEVILKVWLIGVLAYIARNVFELVPWPFEGLYGYKHLKVKEVTNSAIFVAFMVTFDSQLQNKVGELKRRFVPTIKN